MFAFFLFSFSTFANSQTSYLCIADESTGFFYDTKLNSWASTKFTPQKYLLTKKDNGWEWKDFGSKSGWVCGEFNQYGIFNCSLMVGHVRFNKNNLRFLRTYIFGYVDGENNNDNTPNVTIGKCSPL